MSELHALVILYHGACPNNNHIQKIKTVLKEFGEANTKASVIALNEEEIAARLSTMRFSSPELQNSYTPEENAIIYIATKFWDDLELGGTSTRYDAFVAHFSAYVASVSFTGADEEMINAIKILCYDHSYSLVFNLQILKSSNPQIFKSSIIKVPCHTRAEHIAVRRIIRHAQIVNVILHK